MCWFVLSNNRKKINDNPSFKWDRKKLPELIGCIILSTFLVFLHDLGHPFPAP